MTDKTTANLSQHKVLIANRGEIALRILRSCKQMGLKTVVVYSDADVNSLHVRYADEAYALGEAQSSKSYLNTDKLMAIAKETQCTLLHPGYGFLSENADFVDLCHKNKLIFVGPSSKVMRQMGDKISARSVAKNHNLPLIEGSDVLSDAKHAMQLAQKVGFPVLLKAKAGGGGKGMRLVSSKDEVSDAFNMASSEALKSFGNGSLYVEKYLIQPRHIEVQVFGKSDGTCLTFGLRDCSIQRRHQKIIEEAGHLNLKNATQEHLFSESKKLCEALNYQGAGTLEFLVDVNENIYFLEMNTRLQVEHPVTEWIYGIDLVQMQILTALGLDADMHQTQPQGHAIEVRIYAEDPKQNFMPSPGTITHLQWPQGHGVRVDSAIASGHKITSFYDPMIAKISCFAQSRKACIEKTLYALKEFKLCGLISNVDFLKRILSNADFIDAKISTQFLNQDRMQALMQEKRTTSSITYALAASLDMHVSKKTPPNASTQKTSSSWWESGLN